MLVISISLTETSVGPLAIPALARHKFCNAFCNSAGAGLVVLGTAAVGSTVEYISHTESLGTRLVLKQSKLQPTTLHAPIIYTHQNSIIEEDIQKHSVTNWWDW